MRLFAGIELSREVVDNLEKLLQRLKPVARIKWSPVANLHITTKFIGEWPDGRLEELAGALRGLPSCDPMPIAVRGLGWFPNPYSPRVFWAAVEAPPTLVTLARETDHALARLGVEPERRPFSPHLTLARVREPIPLTALQQAVAALPDTRFGEFTADRFFLYLSVLQPQGSEYTKLAAFPLQKT
jgi:RNA 2',3'-cyclic 3'-phosphodiesterase